MIPRILHQIFLGTMPERERAFTTRMKQMNPEWQYRFWSDCGEFSNDPYIRYMQGVGKKPAFIADRLRLLILAAHGGVYLDADCKPVKPLNTLPVWDLPFVDFVFAHRCPYRPGVALHRGIPIVDNFFLASAPAGKMVQRLLALYTPEGKVVNGYATGIEILRTMDYTCISTGVNAFCSMKETPEAIVYHDADNLGSWVDPAERLPIRFVLQNAKQPA